MSDLLGDGHVRVRWTPGLPHEVRVVRPVEPDLVMAESGPEDLSAVLPHRTLRYEVVRWPTGRVDVERVE